MNKRKVIFMGSKPVGYKCLKILLGNRNVEVSGVLTRKKGQDVWWDNKYRVYRLASKNNIPILNVSEVLETEIDFIFSIQYHKILDKKVLEHPNYGAINLHMAPLPEYRGCNQFSFAIINKENYFGTTLHYMDASIDSGDIIAEKRFKISENIRVNELYEITEKKSVELFKENLTDILDLDVKSIPQDDFVKNRGCNYYKREDIYEIKELNLSWSKEKIYRYIRALDFPPFEPPYLKIDNKKIYLTFEKNRGD
mgnify:CR=1 FL=1